MLLTLAPSRSAKPRKIPAGYLTLRQGVGFVLPIEKLAESDRAWTRSVEPTSGRKFRPPEPKYSGSRDVKRNRPDVFRECDSPCYNFRMTIDEFKNTELKVGRVLSAERVEGSEKLLKMQVSLGGDPEEIRQILAGIGKAYTPEEMVGKNIIVVVNLDPRTLMGEESRGMMLAATDEEGLPVALTVERDVSPGTEIR